MLDVDAGAALELLQDEMAERAGARRRRRQRLGAGERHQLGDRAGPERRIGDEHEAVGRHHGDVGEVLERVVADIRVDGGSGQVRSGARHQQAVAIGLRARDQGRPDAAAVAGLVFHIELLPERGRELGCGAARAGRRCRPARRRPRSSPAAPATPALAVATPRGARLRRGRRPRPMLLIDGILGPLPDHGRAPGAAARHGSVA